MIGHVLDASRNLPLHSKDGKEVPVHYLSLSLVRDNGTSLLCGVFTDLTEEKLHLRELTAANARLTAESGRTRSKAPYARRTRWRPSASSRAALRTTSTTR